MKTILILLTLTVSATAADRCYTAEGKRVRCIDAPSADVLRDVPASRVALPSPPVGSRQAPPIQKMPDKLSGNGPHDYLRNWRASKDSKPVAGTIGNALALDVIQTDYQAVVPSP